MSFFQIASGPILSIPIYSKYVNVNMAHVNFLWKKWPEPTRWARQSLDFLLHSRLVNSPLLLAIWSELLNSIHMGILTKEIVLMHEWMMHMQFEYLIPASFGLMMLLEQQTPWYLLKLEGTKVHVGIGTIYKRILQFPLIPHNMPN